MEKDKCRRCGMCCYVATCQYGEDSKRGLWGRCSYLKVNKDFTTTCTNEEAVKHHVGLGCALTRTRKDHEEYYGKHLIKFKQTYLKEKNNEN